MATYQKRGYKPKAQEEIEEVIQETSTTAEVFTSLDDTASKSEAWVSKNQNIILGVIAVIAVGVLGFLAYQQWVQKPYERLSGHTRTVGRPHAARLCAEDTVRTVSPFSKVPEGHCYSFRCIEG